jgi:subfamily B ATP-binding cassette protein MsbA
MEKEKKTLNENLRPITKYLKPYKRQVWLAFVFVIAEQGLRLVSPVVFGKVIDEVTKDRGLTKWIVVFLAGWVLLDILASLATRIRIKKVSVIAYSASADLVLSSISHLLRLPMQYHKDKKIGEVVERITRADQFLYRIIEDGVFYILPNLISSVLVFGIVFWINWIIGIAYLLFIVGYIVITILKTNPIIAYQKKTNKLFENVYGNIFDHTSNVLNIKSNTAEKYEDEFHKKGFKKGSDYNYKQVTFWTNLTSYQNLVKNLSSLVIFSLALFFISNGTMSIGKFITLIFYVNMLSSNIQWLGGYYKSLQESIVTVARNEELFNEAAEEYENENLLHLEDCEGKIEFKDVSFAYDKEDVLSGISFVAQPGKMFAIVGKSGEGKSTLVNLISKYLNPKNGEVRLDDVDISKIRLDDLRKQIAIVPQEVQMFNDSVANNIRYARLDATDEEIKSAAKLAQADEFIAKFPKGYDQVVGERGVKLSVGQKQRVAIARAILRDPRILILDEATSALDSESERLVQKALDEVMKGRTTFVIAHRLSTIRKADQIIVLENGKIAESGNHEELMKHGGIYKKLSELQNITV